MDLSSRARRVEQRLVEFVSRGDPAVTAAMTAAVERRPGEAP